MNIAELKESTEDKLRRSLYNWHWTEAPYETLFATVQDVLGYDVEAREDPVRVSIAHCIVIKAVRDAEACDGMADLMPNALAILRHYAMGVSIAMAHGTDAADMRNQLKKQLDAE